MARVTVGQIREALTVCGGNVKRAAKVLGMARNNLYKRMASSRIDPNDYRSNTPTGVTVTDDAHAPQGATVADGVKGTGATARVPVSRRAIFPAGVGTRTFPHVSTPAAAVEESPKTLRIARSVYLRPEQVKALDDACLDLPRVLREKLSPSKVLEKFMDDCFAEWLQSKLAAKPKGRAK